MAELNIENPSPSSSTDSDIELFNLDSQAQSTGEEVPRYKRIKTSFQTYVRLNYWNIFKVMSWTMLALIMVIIVLVIHNIVSGLHPPTALSSSTASTVMTTASSRSSSSVEATTMSTSPPLPPVDPRAIKCPKHCRLQGCNLAYVNYEMLKYYTCCQCHDSSKYKLIRIEELVVQKEFYLVLMDLTVDVRNYTRFDLANLPPLQNLDGIWNLISDSDTTFWLRYGPITLVQPEDDPDEDSL